MTTTTRHPPRQARASAKRALILEATERLLTVRAPGELTTRMVAAEADIPIGSVYRYFANMDDLLYALFTDLNAETLQSIRSLSRGRSGWREELRALLSIVEAMHERHPIYGALMHHLSIRDEVNDPIVAALSEKLADATTSLDRKAAQHVAATIVALIDGIERRYHALPHWV